MIPSFPSGATILSLHLASLQLGRAASRTAATEAFYGRNVEVHNRFGHLAKEFAEFALGGTISAADLIQHHTAFPIYASILADETARGWAAALAKGESGSWSRLFPTKRDGELFVASPRLCPQCVAEDEARYGLAYWRVQHQIPFIRFCPEHHSRLCDRCSACKTPFAAGAEQRLPGSPCVNGCAAGGTAAGKVTESAGDRAVAELIRRASLSEAIELSPLLRARLVRQGLARYTPASFQDDFQQWWAARAQSSIHKLLGVGYWFGRDDWVSRFITTGAAHVPFPMLVAVVAFAREHLNDSEWAHFQAGSVGSSGGRPPLLPERYRGDDLIADLWADAARLGLPTNVAAILGQGRKMDAINAVGAHYVAALIDRLDPARRAQLAFRMGREADAE